MPKGALEELHQASFPQIPCAIKMEIKKLKREATGWEKMFAKHVADKGLVSKIKKELLKLNNNKASNLIRKWVKDLNSCPAPSPNARPQPRPPAHPTVDKWPLPGRCCPAETRPEPSGPAMCII